MEKMSLHMSSAGRSRGMIICEEASDISYLGSTAADLSDAMVCTNVGEIRRVLGESMTRCVMSELCQADAEDYEGG